MRAVKCWMCSRRWASFDDRVSDTAGDGARLGGAHSRQSFGLPGVRSYRASGRGRGVPPIGGTGPAILDHGAENREASAGQSDE